MHRYVIVKLMIQTDDMIDDMTALLFVITVQCHNLSVYLSGGRFRFAPWRETAEARCPTEGPADPPVTDVRPLDLVSTIFVKLLSLSS